MVRTACGQHVEMEAIVGPIEDDGVVGYDE
jgi:hypothetical protein